MIPEPYRIKMVEPIRLIPRDQREAVLQKAGYNLFQIPAEEVFIDLLTDSGTGAMSAQQWSAIMLGDESYAGARSFYHFRDTVEELFGYPFVLPAHQGRGAERVFFVSQVKQGNIVPSNAHFDTTRANLEWIGATAVDFPAGCANNPYHYCSFKGNMDTERLIALLESQADKVPFVMLTITNNRAAGQPVSMRNVKKVSEICRNFCKPLFIDAARHAENAYFIQNRDSDYEDVSIEAISRELFSYADGMLMSAKKDGLSNIGGFIAVRDKKLYESVKDALILMEGFTTYGGLAGRDLEAIAVGLREAVQEEYLTHRIGQVEFLSQQLVEQGVPIYVPAGGHAVYVDSDRFFAGRMMRLPGQSLAAELYLEGGIRSCDIGSSMFEKRDSERQESGLSLELLRLAIPRRTYTETHLRYVSEVFGRLKSKYQEIPELCCVSRPKYLGHFSAVYA